MKLTQHHILSGVVLFSYLLFFTFTLKAQNARFSFQGSITYEKRVNMYALYRKELSRSSNNSFMQSFFENYQKNNPQFKTLKSELLYKVDRTLFTPEQEKVRSNASWGEPTIAPQINTIFTYTLAGTSVIQKNVFEETYLVKDSTRKINWKITDEFREIAGYECRRANALIMDSIYVVAFYTDRIPVSGGPESFSGLPGMILGVALPHENITWFATSVVDQPIHEERMKVPSKGKNTTNESLRNTLKDVFKNWGNSALENMKALFL